MNGYYKCNQYLKKTRNRYGSTKKPSTKKPASCRKPSDIAELDKIVEEEVAKARHNMLPAMSKIWVALRFSNHRAMYTVTGDRRMLEPRINGRGHR